jgi:Family of unknown function (DUF6491)
MKRPVCAVALLALGMSLTAPAGAATDPNCIAPINFWSWKAQDKNTVILTDRARHNFKVSLQPGCTDMSFALNIGVKSFSTSRLQCIARGDWVIVPRTAGIPGDRCAINKVEAYTPEMAKVDAAALAAAKAAAH